MPALLASCRRHIKVLPTSPCLSDFNYHSCFGVLLGVVSAPCQKFFGVIESAPDCLSDDGPRLSDFNYNSCFGVLLADRPWHIKSYLGSLILAPDCLSDDGPRLSDFMFCLHTY